MRLWSIQSSRAWEELQSEGILRGKEKFVDLEFKSAYHWMMEHMKEKIGHPKTPNQYPIWAWFQSIDEMHKKPDLRRSGYLPIGSTGYRIEVIKKDEDVLLSDFELWHTPLAYKTYIANSEKESVQFEKKLIDRYGTYEFEKLPKDAQQKIAKSWEKVFDMDYDVEYFAMPYKEKSIQATFWELSLDDVVKVDKFKAR